MVHFLAEHRNGIANPFRIGRKNHKTCLPIEQQVQRRQAASIGIYLSDASSAIRETAKDRPRRFRSILGLSPLSLKMKDWMP